MIRQIRYLELWILLCVTSAFVADRTPLVSSSNRMMLGYKYRQEGKNGSSTLFMQQRQISRISTCLSMKQNTTQEDTSFSAGLSFGFEQKGVVACDLFAILIACQLMGLLDVVNDPYFSRNGGWFQPIPAVPLTLNILVQHIALVGIIWFPISAIRFSTGDETSTVNSRASNGRLQKILVMVIIFSILRLCVVLMSDSNDFGLAYALRDCYFMGLSVTSLRLLYRQYFG